MKWENLLLNESMDGSRDWKNDYDTIVCSTLFRRLQDKAQVFPLEEDDYVRTRLTHSLEVSAIGKKLGELTFQRLKQEKKSQWFETHEEKDFADILLCAGLIHDIGNPPFGHFGEYAIREWFQAHLGELTLGGKPVTEILTEWQKEDLYHFEGNAQSLRLLSKTPYLGTMEGFNLSCSVLASIIKYPASSLDLKHGSRRGSGNKPESGRESQPGCVAVGYKKMGYYAAERELFAEINEKTGMNGCRHPLSYLLEAADDIAYRASDLEDAMVKKVLSLPQIVEALEGCAGNWEKAEALGKHAGNLAKAEGQKLRDLYEEEVALRHYKPELTAVQRWNQYTRERMLTDAVDSFVKNYDSIMEGTFPGDLFDGTRSGHLIEAISRLSEEAIYTSPTKIKAELLGRRIIDSLLHQFMAAAVKYDTEEPMTFIEKRTIDIISTFYKSMYHTQKEGKGEAEKLYLRILMVTDYISGMTDNYAKRLYKELLG